MGGTIALYRKVNMTSMLRGGKNDTYKGLSYGGCSCHNTKAAHRKAKRIAKRKEARAWKTEYNI